MTPADLEALIASVQAELLAAPGQPRRTREADQEIVLNSIQQLMDWLASARAQLQGRYRKGLQLTKLKGPSPI